MIQETIFRFPFLKKVISVVVFQVTNAKMIQKLAMKMPNIVKIHPKNVVMNLITIN